MKILTFDIEEWFHCDFVSGDFSWQKYEVRIHDGVDRILDSLQQQGTKATFFCLGWIAREYPEVIRKIHSMGHEIGSHSDVHELATRFDRNTFAEDTRRSVCSIEDVLGEKVRIYRAPAFSITENNLWAFDILAENGIEYDCTVFPAAHDYGGFPSFGSGNVSIIRSENHSIREFPISPANVMGRNLVYSGGGFFRLLPYWFIRKQFQKADYVMTYFHPRDFDTRQPMLEHLPKMRKFKSYYGLDSAFSKFESLMNEFTFDTVLSAAQKIDWNNVPVVNINPVTR